MAIRARPFRTLEETTVRQLTRRTSSRASLSAVAATLLACGGAALIAVAPDWVTRLARVIAVTISQGRGSSQEQLSEAIRPAPPGAGVATAADRLDLATVDNRTLENHQEAVH
jgi:hypothetical protein